MMPHSLTVALSLTLVQALHAQQPTGKQIIQTVLANFPQKDFLCQARLTCAASGDAAYNDKTVDIQLQTRNTSEAIFSVIVVTAPTNLEGNAVLSVVRKDGTQAIYQREGGRLDAVRHKFNRDELGRSFVDTDFAYEDLDFGFLRWPEHKLVAEKRRQGRDCYVIESEPAARQSAQYSKVVSWIDKEGSLLMLAEGYGADGKLLKVFDIRSLKQFEGGWFIKTMNLKNVTANRQTKLEVSQFEFSTNLDDRYFSPETFGRIAAFKFPQGTKNY